MDRVLIDVGVCLFAFLFLVFFIKESPKFYVSVKKYEQAREVYKYIASVNKREMFSNKLEGEGMVELSIENHQD